MNQKIKDQIFNIPSLSRKEEIQLFKLSKAEDLIARNKIIEAYMKLVIMIVEKGYSGGDEDDLIQVGNIALIDAVGKFNAENGATFGGFASSYIHGRIKRYLEEDVLVKKSNNFWEDQRILEKIQNKFIKKFGYMPTYNELYELMNAKWKKKRGWKVSKDYFNRLLEPQKCNSGVNSLDQIQSKEIDLDTTIDISRILSKLNPKEQTILKSWYGIGGTKPLAPVNIAKQLKLTKVRIYQIRTEAFKKVKDFLAQDNINLALAG